jgi:hypothetical protein
MVHYYIIDFKSNSQSGPVYMEESYPARRVSNGEILAIIETYSNPWLFTWCSRVIRLGEFPAERGGISYRLGEINIFHVKPLPG